MRYWSVIMGILSLALLGATEWQHSRRHVAEVQVQINRPGDYLFLLEENLVSDIQHFLGDSLQSDPKFAPSEINIALLEEFVESHPAVERTEVYLDFAGILHCRVQQRLPVLYVSGGTLKGYWDANGCQFFGDESNSVKCTKLVNAADSTVLLSTISFVHAMQSDSLWTVRSPRLEFNPQGELVLHPKNASYDMVWGNPQLDSSRLARWYFFNREILPRAGANHYKHINLKYKDQIVALKNE